MQGKQLDSDGLRLWFGFLGGAISWFLHLALVYIGVGIVCPMGGRGLLYVISAAAAAVALAAGIVSWMGWRELDREARGSLIGQMEGSRLGFMLFFGMLSSGLFLLAILMATLPILFMNPCFPAGRI